MTPPVMLENRIFVPRFLAGWLAFTAAAGFVNAAAFTAAGSLVSHITGSVTNFAVAPSSIVLVVVAFIVGGMIAVYSAERLKTSLLAYAAPILGVGALLLGVAIAGRRGAFGAFGDDDGAFPLVATLALAMGMLNAAVGAATANKIRVTHLTGPVTDLAGHLVRGEHKWAALRFANLASFVVGAAVAAKLGRHFEYDIFGIGAVILVVGLGLTLKQAPRLDFEVALHEERRHILRPRVEDERAGIF